MRRLFITLFLLLTVLPVFAGDFSLYQQSGHTNPKWDGLVKAGFEAFDSGDMPTSYAFMQKAYNMGCRDGLLFFRFGLYYESAKNYKEAAKFFGEASEKLPKQYPNYPETARIHEHLGRVYYQSNQIDKAISELEMALKAAPDNFVLLIMLGQIYRGQQKYQDAITYFEKALTSKIPSGLKTDPGKTIFTELMISYCELKNFDACLKYSEQVLAISPGDGLALSYRQMVQKEMYKKREQEAMKKIVE